MRDQGRNQRSADVARGAGDHGAAVGAETHVGDVAVLADVALVLTASGRGAPAAGRRGPARLAAEFVDEWAPADVDRLGSLLQRFAGEVFSGS